MWWCPGSNNKHSLPRRNKVSVTYIACARSSAARSAGGIASDRGFLPEGEVFFRWLSVVWRGQSNTRNMKSQGADIPSMPPQRSRWHRQ